MGISHGRRKSKGSAAERDLIHKFWAGGWAAVRVAGSGSTQFPSPDLLVGNSKRKLALEVKAISNHKKYFPKDEVSSLEYFAEKFGAEAWLVIKFDREGYYFIQPSNLKITTSSFVATLDICKEKGLSFEKLISNYKK